MTVCESCEGKYKQNRLAQKYCSIDCYRKMRVNKAIRTYTCKGCKKPFQRSRKNNVTYCTIQCYRGHTPPGKPHISSASAVYALRWDTLFKRRADLRAIMMNIEQEIRIG